MPMTIYSRTSSLPRRFKTTVAPSLFLISFAVAFVSQPKFHLYNAPGYNSAPSATPLKFRRPLQNPAPKSFFISLSDSNFDGDEKIPDEPLSSPTEQERMEQIRHIQRSFYQDEGTGVQPPQHGSTLVQDLPLWRVQWTELPGYQNVLNVHVPHYTNMFLKILNSKDVEDRYFGHIFLPGGSENLDNEEYRLVSATMGEDKAEEGVGEEKEKTKASLTGVLMKITDYTQFDDGRLMLIVQALERFRVVEVKRQHTPHAIATVEIIPDQELVETVEARTTKEEEEGVGEESGIDDEDSDEKFLPKAVDEAFLWHPFEARPLSIKECAVPVPNNKDGQPQSGQAVAISPLMNFDASLIHDRALNDSRRSSEEVKYSSLYSQTSIKRVMDLEYAVWVQLDELIHLLQRLISGSSNVIPQQISKIPVPTQILGLLPKDPPHPWPSQFSLEKYAVRLSKDNTAMVGTASRSPFVRVDDMDRYPPLRRAQRLSYVIWILTDSLVNAGIGVQDKQIVLEMGSIALRLKAAQTKLENIGGIIRQVLNEA